MDLDAAEAGSSFQAKEEIIAKLTTLGFSRNAAIKGCYYTGNYSADLAAAWILENQDKNLDGPLEEDLEFEDDEEEEEFPEGIDLHKMVFVVNMELDMGVGKVGAQCAHAAVALHRMMIENPERFGTMLMSWEQFGETKIVDTSIEKSKELEILEKHFADTDPNDLKNWVSEGFSLTDPDYDRFFNNLVWFLMVSFLTIGGQFILYYLPDMHMRDWATREAYLDIDRRRKAGLPLVDPYYVPPEQVILPSEEEIGDQEIII